MSFHTNYWLFNKHWLFCCFQPSYFMNMVIYINHSIHFYMMIGLMACDLPCRLVAKRWQDKAGKSGIEAHVPRSLNLVTNLARYLISLGLGFSVFFFFALNKDWFLSSRVSAKIRWTTPFSKIFLNNECLILPHTLNVSSFRFLSWLPTLLYYVWLFTPLYCFVGPCLLHSKFIRTNIDMLSPSSTVSPPGSLLSKSVSLSWLWSCVSELLSIASGKKGCTSPGWAYGYLPPDAQLLCFFTDMLSAVETEGPLHLVQRERVAQEALSKYYYCNRIPLWNRSICIDFYGEVI